MLIANAALMKVAAYWL